MAQHDFSLAQPKRLFLDRDEDGMPCHVLAGERLTYGTLLLLQLADNTWIPGAYRWDPPTDPAEPLATPRFTMYLAHPDAADDSASLSVEFDLPPDAVLRVHPSWKRMMNPRPPRRPRRTR